MTTFRDGPAKGKTMFLRNSPKILRIVEKGGKWDALDDPNDHPRRGETIHLYKLVHSGGMMHVNAIHGLGGFYPISEYELT